MPTDEKEKLASALEHILSRYEGAENDPVWDQAREVLEQMAPKPMFLSCPKCKFLHHDQGEWASKPHRTHLCLKCGHKWRPHAYPTVGIVLPGMEAEESMGFLRFFEAWKRHFKSKNPSASDEQLQILRGVLLAGWSGGRDFWMVQGKPQPQKTTPEGVPVVDLEDDDPGDSDVEEEIPEADPEIAKHVQEGKLRWEDVLGLGFDPRSYIEYGLKPPGEENTTSPEESAQLADDLGIDFGTEEEDPETGVSF